MITAKQRAKLKALSHHMKPAFNIGKDGLDDKVIIAMDQYLAKNELLKINILNNNLDDRDTLIGTILVNLDADFVQYLGNKLTIYKASKESKIEL